jgi:hypothetical protein
MDSLCCSIEVGMHDLDVSFDQQNITHKGKAPKVVPGFGNGSDGSPMRAKVGVQWSNHQLIRPVGGWGSDNTTSFQEGPWVVDCLRPVLYSPPPVLVDSVRTPQIRKESVRSLQGVHKSA